MASEAQVILNRIKKLTRVLQKTDMFSTDPVAQKLNAKFTGLLGKLSSYVNQNTAEPTPDSNNPAIDAQSPTRTQAPQGQKVPARSESINETKLRAYIRNLILSELTDAEKDEQKTELENQVSDLQGQVAQIKADSAKKTDPLQKKIADLQKQKEKVSKMATK
jgi:hypothetical protein